jgi:putative PEP-CTERM system histidine kinase
VPALGVVVLGRPRVTFRMDAEVIDLLRVLAHEVAIHLAQQRATAVLLQTHDLREYGERFAFVAHDIKNVSSQLSLLLSNAETHVANPDFQQDMLATVRASVGRIGALIRRLEPARTPAAPVLLDPASLLSALSSSWSACGQITLALDIAPTAAGARVLMDPAAFRAAVGHLLDNAVNALRGAGTVRLALHATPVRVVLDIIDDGPGMTAEFVRDRLFQPFASGTPGGTGLGAFQARELLRVAGGELAVQSRPGAGTTMRLVLPRYDAPTSDATPAPTAAARLLSPAGA